MSGRSPLDRHEKIALSYSGGKDSTAVLHLLREHLDRITVYHVDTGDLLPEIVAAVARVEASVPHFVRIRTDPQAWMGEHGMPSDLVPHSSHPIGVLMGEPRATKLAARYDCCAANLMHPLFKRVYDDGCTLLIRGTKRADMARLPAQSGDVHVGVELWYPLEDWSHADVFAFLDREGVELPDIYNYVTNAPECARCPAWWNESRAAYLHRNHPDLWEDYTARLRMVAAEIAGPLQLLEKELSA